MSKHNHFRITACILLSGLILLTFLGLTERGMNAAGLRRLSQANDDYLKASFNRSLQTFVVLTAVKTGLAVVEGSEIGVGFGIQIGNVVQAAYDYVDMAWRTVLASMAILTGTRFLLQAAGLLDHWSMAAFFAFFLLALVCKWFLPRWPGWQRFFRGLAFFTAVATVLLYIALPASIALGRNLSKRITAPSVDEAEAGFRQFRSETFPDDASKKEGIWSKLVEAKDRLKRIAAILANKTNDLIEWVIKLIAGYAFDCIVFPLGLFIGFYWLFKFLIRLIMDQAVRGDRQALFRATPAASPPPDSI
ncbi:MAG TPA: hypothetical protein VGB38_02920 [bacterium]